jgi:mRNA-degrading endonuclease RelE of RelBE toxin-antitoxin system
VTALRDASTGEPLLCESAGLWKYKVRRFRIVYEIDRKKRMIKFFAIGHRREVYEELAEQFRHLKQRRK